MNFSIIDNTLRNSLETAIFLFIMILILMSVASCQRHSDTKMDKARYNIKSLEKVINRYYNDHNRYPSTEEGLQYLVKRNDPTGNVYLQGLISDPWGNPYNYLCPGVHNVNGYDLWTYGADNKPEGKDYNADIVNW